MKVKNAIKKRKSIRKYKNKKISKKIINELIEAARVSPSAKNSQPWKFKIIEEKEVFEKLKKVNAFRQNFVYEAPLVIVCCADLEMYSKKKFKSEFSNVSTKERAIADLAIASQSLVLRATELGLGSCYVGLLNEKKIKKELKIPKDYLLHYVIVLGYANEKGIKTMRKNREEILI